MSDTSTEPDELTIGELAARFGLATHVLRHWETVGLLAPAERVSGRRRYRASHIMRVALIVRGKQAGLTLAQIGEILNAPDGPSRKTLLRRHWRDLDQRIAEIEASKAMIQTAIDCPSPDFTQCPHCQQHLQRLQVAHT